MIRNRYLQAAALFLLGLLILYGLIRTVHPDQVTDAIRKASLGWMGIGELGFLAFLVIRGWRWLIILRASAPTAALSDATAVTGIGFAVNSVSPFKLGELIRIGAIAPRAGIGIGEAGATVVVERVLDVLALLVIALVAALLSGAGSHSLWLWSGVFLISAGAIAIGLLGFLMVSYPQPTIRVINRLAARFPSRIERLIDNFAASVLRGFTSLRSPRRLAAASLLSILTWLCIIAALSAFFRSLSSELTLPTLVLACTVLTISQAISITPGSVGTYEGFLVLVFSTFGAGPASLLTAVAVLSHVGNIVALLVGGAIGASWLRLNRPAFPVRAERAVPG
jgi:uncharacterized protein (TIRG00374 family)